MDLLDKSLKMLHSYFGQTVDDDPNYTQQLGRSECVLLKMIEKCLFSFLLSRILIELNFAYISISRISAE